MPERDIRSLVVMGKGAGGGQEILPSSSPSSSSPSGPILAKKSAICENIFEPSALLVQNLSKYYKIQKNM